MPINNLLPYTRKLQAFDTVAAGSTATMLLPKGPTYLSISLYAQDGAGVRTEAELKTDIDEIRLVLNGVTIWQMSATDAIMRHKYYGGSISSDGVLPIDLAPWWARTTAMEDLLAWGTLDVGTLALEVDLASGSGITDLRAYAQVLPNKQPLGAIMQVRRITWAPSATGEQEFADVPSGIGALMAMHLDHTGSAVINGLRIEADQLNIHNPVEAVYRRMLGSQAGRAVQTDYIHFEPTIRDRQSEYIPLSNLQDFRIIADVGTAGSVPIILETFNAPLGVVSLAS